MPTLAPHMPAKLAQCARELICQRGVVAVTLDDVATRAGVTKGSFYHHFRSKDDLVTAACGFFFDESLAVLAAAAESESDPLARLAAAVGAGIERETSVDGAFGVHAFAIASVGDGVGDRWRAWQIARHALFQGLLKDAQDAGAVSPDDPDGALTLLLATLDGVREQVSADPDLASERFRDSLTEGLLAALGAPTTTIVEYPDGLPAELL